MTPASADLTNVMGEHLPGKAGLSECPRIPLLNGVPAKLKKFLSKVCINIIPQHQNYRATWYLFGVFPAKEVLLK